MPAVHIPQDAATLPDYARLAGRLEVGGYDRIWVGEVNDVDAVSAATLAATGTDRAEIALFCNVFTRAPTTLAMTASTLAQLAPGRAQIVLGSARRSSSRAGTASPIVRCTSGSVTPCASSGWRWPRAG